MKWLRAGRRACKYCLLSAAGLTVIPTGNAAVADEGRTEALEEVIVTARKVRENVQDIPLSVQVLTGELLDRLDLSTLYDLQFEVPGLIVSSAGLNGTGFALRGVADQGGTSASVAPHLNGVYLASSQLAIAPLFDLERIEVLKGPQGTLYGRNSTGGTFNFITRAPEDAFGGELEAALGSFNTLRTQGHVNIPLAQSGAARLAFIGSNGDGFIRNNVDARRFAERDYWGLRSSFRFDPGNWRIDLVAQRTRDDGGSTELWLPNPEYLPDPDDIHLTTVTLANPFLHVENNNVNLTAEYPLGATLLRSISGYADSELNNLDDCAGQPAFQSCVRGADPFRDRQWSQEIQLASDTGERADWLAGTYFFSGEASRHFFQLLPRFNPQPLNDQLSTSKDSVWALFGQATLHFGHRWSATGGLRYSDETSEISDMGVGVRDNKELVVLQDDRSHLSWRLDLEYEAHEALLLYSGLSTGFKSGGVTPALLPEGDYNRFDSEELLSFEAGLKAQWPDLGLVLDAAAFHYDFDNLQITSIYSLPGEGRIITEIENAPGAKVYGIDLASSLQMTERLNLSVGLIWLPKREFLDYTSPRTNQDLSGNQLSRSPEWSALASLGYSRPLVGGQFSLRLEYSYRSQYYYTKENIESHSEDAHGLLNLVLRLEPTKGSWYAFASGRNLTDEDYFHQVFLQATPGYPTTYELGFGVRF